MRKPKKNWNSFRNKGRGRLSELRCISSTAKMILGLRQARERQILHQRLPNGVFPHDCSFIQNISNGDLSPDARAAAGGLGLRTNEK